VNRPTWSKNAIAKIDGKDVVGVIVGRCWHDGRMHFDVREGEKVIHVDVPAERVWQ
tara:strand:- start:1026 stop:1193 length:168 start_codon:yes stop_codon:yes gene_type:complete